MKNKKIVVLCIALLIAVTFSTLLFFGVGEVEKSGIQICSFIFIILTEVIIFGNILICTSSKKLNTFSIVGFGSTTFLYSVCSLLLNMLLKNSFTTLKGILIFNFSLLLIYLFVLSIITLFKKEK